MRLQEHNNKLETNVEAESQDFSIGDPSVIIAMLRNNMYAYKARTLVQEYLCNARDAMREAGKGNEFTITVPTRLNPVFKVRDYGLGITPERMANVFVRYGASTKRKDNSQTGGFGIGAKSAWSYTDSFTIISVVDGVKRSYVAHIGVNNQGRLDLISTDETTEKNGTEIQIAVKPNDIEEFREAIFRATYFWTDQPKLKGELHPPELIKGDVISDLLEIVDSNMLPSYVQGYNDNIMVVIDGIPYPLSQDLMNKIKPLCELRALVRKKIMLYFGNGVVEVAASRESIADSKLTVVALEKLGKRALLEAKTFISNAFGAVKDTSEYLQTYAKLSKLFDVDEFAKYGDYSITSQRITNPTFKKLKITIAHCMGKYGRGKVDRVTKDELTEARKEIELCLLPHLFYVATQESKVIQNKRLREYFKTNTHAVLIEVLNTSVPEKDAKGQPVLDKDNKQVYKPVSYPAEFKQIIGELAAKDFASITYVDPPKEAKVKVKREDTEICLHPVYGSRYNGGRYKYTTLAKNTQKWIYVQLADGGSWPRHKETLQTLQDFTWATETTQVCGIAERGCKMVEGDPNFILLTDWLKHFKVTNELVLAAKFTFKKNDGIVNILKELKGIEDDFLLEMLREYADIAKSKVCEVPKLIADKIAENKEVKDFKEADAKFAKLVKDDYSLVTECGHYANKKELAFYINAKYNARKSKKGS